MQITIRAILTTTMLACHAVAGAQDYQGEAMYIADSLTALSPEAYTMPDVDEPYIFVFDSVLNTMVSSDVQARLARGRFSYSVYSTPPVVMGGQDKYPSGTCMQLLAAKYGIDNNGPSNGCMWQQAYDLYDSLTTIEVKKKYGPDFFSQVAVEADSLERNGLGLILPYIKSPEATNAALQKAFAFVKQVPYKDGINMGRYIQFEFTNGQLVNASICHRMFGIQQDLSTISYWTRITNIAKGLGWQPPLFAGQSADRLVLWNIDNGELSFR